MEKPVRIPYKRTVIGYLRMSTQDQNLEKQKADILAFAKARRLGNIDWVEEPVSGVKTWRKREIAKAVESLSDKDWLIVPEIYGLGSSTLDILDMLAELKRKEVIVYAIKGDWTLDASIKAKPFLKMVKLFGEIERDLISVRTKKGLEARKAEGIKLGRPKGPGKSKLDPYRPEIEDLLRNGSTLRFISKRYGTSEANLHNWIKKKLINKTPRP